MIRSDWRWLAHDPVARALTDRYVRALRDDWYTLPHEDSGAFRTRIGLDPKPVDTACACINALLREARNP